MPGIFASLTSKTIGPFYVQAEWELSPDGYAGRARLGDLAEVEIDHVKNPVTGAPSPFTWLHRRYQVFRWGVLRRTWTNIVPRRWLTRGRN